MATVPSGRNDSVKLSADGFDLTFLLNQIHEMTITDVFPGGRFRLRGGTLVSPKDDFEGSITSADVRFAAIGRGADAESFTIGRSYPKDDVSSPAFGGSSQGTATIGAPNQTPVPKPRGLGLGLLNAHEKERTTEHPESVRELEIDPLISPIPVRRPSSNKVDEPMVGSRSDVSRSGNPAVQGSTAPLQQEVKHVRGIEIEIIDLSIRRGSLLPFELVATTASADLPNTNLVLGNAPSVEMTGRIEIQNLSSRSGEIDFEMLTGIIDLDRLRFSLDSIIWANSLNVSVRDGKGTAPGIQGSSVRFSSKRADANLRMTRGSDGLPEISGNASMHELWAKETIDRGHQMRSETVTIEGLSLIPAAGIKIERVLIDHLRADVTEKIFAPELLKEERDDSGGVDEPGTDLRVGEIAIGAGSKIVFSDITHGRGVTFEFDVSSAKIGPLDALRQGTLTHVFVDGRMIKSAPFAMNAQAYLLSPSPDFQVRAQAKDMPIAAFAGYLEEIQGIEIDAGTASTVVALSVTENNVDGDLGVTIKDLEMSPLNQSQADAFEARFGIDIDKALALAEGKRRIIDVTFPISGTLDNIDVDTSQLEDVAIGNAVESILPWNWGTSKTKTSRQEFVVSFPPGSIQIEAVSADRLLGVAEFLRRDPDKFCLLYTSPSPRDRG